jgi:hypothetical protein
MGNDALGFHDPSAATARQDIAGRALAAGQGIAANLVARAR